MVEPGWYADPTGRHRLRYWQSRWTRYVSDGRTVGHDRLRQRWRRVLGTILLAQLGLVLLVPVLAFWMIGGDSYPQSRIGVTRNSAGRIEALAIACPGEQITGVELERRGRGDGTTTTVLWAAHGNAEVPAHFTVGAPVPGLSTDTALASALRPRDHLRLTVTTSDLPHSYGLRFRPRDVRRHSILTHLGQHLDHDAYRAAVLEDTPCDRRPAGSLRLLGGTIAAQLVLAGAGLLVLVLPRYRAPQDAHVSGRSDASR